MEETPEEKRKDTANTSSSVQRRNITIVAVTAVVILFALIVVWILKSDKKKQAETDKEAALPAELHQFPPIDFTDTLYHKEVEATNEDETPKVVFYFEKDSAGQPTKNKVHETHLYPGNKKYIDGNVKNNRRDGLWYAYYPDGTVQTKAYYVNGRPDGQYTVYYKNGAVRYTGRYDMGRRTGKWHFYKEDGSLAQVKDFENPKHD